MTEAAKPDDLRNFCIMLYGIYALSVVLGSFAPTLLLALFSLLTIVIAYILQQSKRKAAKDTPFASHLQWMNRTFWIGTGVIFPVAVIIGLAFVWHFTDIAPVINAMGGDDPDITIGSMQAYVQGSEAKASMITMVAMIPAVVWWLRRCWAGYLLAKDGKPVENVRSWL